MFGLYIAGIVSALLAAFGFAAGYQGRRRCVHDGASQISVAAFKDVVIGL